MKPIYQVPEGFEGKIDESRSQSVRSCPDCSDCVDVHQLTDGEHLLLVSGGQHMVITNADFEGLKGLQL